MLNDLIIIPVQIPVWFPNERVSNLLAPRLGHQPQAKDRDQWYLLRVLEPGQLGHNLVLCSLNTITFKIGLGLGL